MYYVSTTLLYCTVLEYNATVKSNFKARLVRAASGVELDR